jgi:hypothetical protein
MEFLLVRLAGIEDRENILDGQGKITGMVAMFNYLPDRDLIVGDNIEGKTNHTLELERGTHRISLGPPHDFTPKEMKIVLKDTTAILPMEVRFEKI